MAWRGSLPQRSPPPSSRRSKARRPGLALLLAVALVARHAGGAVLGPLEIALLSAYDTPGDGGSLRTQINGLVPGSCGCGSLNTTLWPYGAVASIDLANPLVATLPLEGCGTCFQLPYDDPVMDSFLLSFAPTTAGAGIRSATGGLGAAGR